ncbi:feruloyl esterase-like protein [Gloeophyllum trabeum ATCC 11539]|uniref:Carboxylic ester hydrolase n=1 Tax=Gloeophyllum trabeum (strain ATCC 11539 / FP-39264 / Madison 617) TaxID=670483 RepID=S7RUX4_GLOTA|nr:feruloyl esterase-like protein [Gloeophyllum trabeum ATCC 11539]EPQ56994.1 feruloyl esterase-like protein [Gloeophyllum trabeum ATCC 11539]
MGVRTALSAVALYGLGAISGARAWETTCTTFTLGNSTGVSVIGATEYQAGDLVNVTNVFSSIETSTLPAFCRIELLITTNSTSNKTANTEVWLPDAWNGRFLGFGNGGFGGGVNVADLGFAAVSQGFAGMSTDTGHSSTVIDGTWGGPHNDDAIIDWNWRALHLSVGVAKQVIQQYYGKPALKAYYLGCSTGGRQGLKSAQDFPEDFDGIVIGSPANWMSHLEAWSIHIDLNVLPVGSPQWIPPELWTGVIHDEVLRQCDALDGLADGVISNPLACNFRPETLACRAGQNTSTCLNLSQIQALHQIYSDYYETNQTYIFGPYYPGGEIGYTFGLLGFPVLPIAQDYFQYFILNDTTWDPTTLNYSLVQFADELSPANANAIETNITAFVEPERNGKIIHYVGWADQLISPGNSLHYYETVHAFMQSNTEYNIDDYYRLFTVPGMQHWYGGYGANAFGGAGQAAAATPPLSSDPVHNVVSAIVSWVEEGVAPDYFIAAYYQNNQQSQGIGFTRPICKYPANVVYRGGNVNDSSSFACV